MKEVVIYEDKATGKFIKYSIPKIDDHDKLVDAVKKYNEKEGCKDTVRIVTDQLLIDVILQKDGIDSVHGRVKDIEESISQMVRSFENDLSSLKASIESLGDFIKETYSVEEE